MQKCRQQKKKKKKIAKLISTRVPRALKIVKNSIYVQSRNAECFSRYFEENLGQHHECVHNCLRTLRFESDRNFEFEKSRKTKNAILLGLSSLKTHSNHDP